MFTLNIVLGHFLVIVLLIAELVINPLRRLFKHELLYCGARHVVATGKEVRVRPTPKICHAAGIETNVSSNGFMLLFIKAIHAGVIIFLIVATVLWERTIQQKTVHLTVSLTTTAQFDETLTPPQGKTFLMSPFPVIGLPQQAVGNLTAFNRNGSLSEGHYRVREDSGMASHYASTCVKTPNSTHTVVAMGAVFVNHEGEKRISCLDGGGTSSNLIAATFKTDPKEQGRGITSLELVRSLSTDTTTTVYAAFLTDDIGETYRGYVAITSRSHFNANVAWSFYGLLRKEDDRTEVWRLSLAIESNSSPIGKPCRTDEIGTWQLTDEEYTCPDGETNRLQPDPVNVKTEPLQNAGLELATGEVEDDENSDLLAWMVEVDYARFWAAETFAKELRERVRADRMFYSVYEGQTLNARDGSTIETVSFGSEETILVVVAVALLFMQILVGIIWKCTQMRRYDIRSEVVSYKAIAAMYQEEVSGTPTDGAERTQLHLGLLKDGANSQRLGIVSKNKWTSHV